MAFSALIGALRVALRLDSSEYTEGLKASKVELRQAAREFNNLGKQIAATGRTLTVGITAPLAAGLGAAIKASAGFEAAMIKVGISTKATAAEMTALETEARKIGKSTIFSAGEAADAMDMLAKTGLSVRDILGGAAKATVDLAAAAGSELEPAASAISDAMQQFGLSASQLPGVVNQITGAVNESKLSFEDFTGASGQAGGVAAQLGVTFEDFNAVIAGTSSLFSSGSDAGTSFKTFLTTLTPKSEEAARAIQAYGLSFFDANGNLRSMAEIAEELRSKLSGLNDEAKTQVLKEIFGTDAMRTAIGLMNQGAEGLQALKARIQETDAAAQAAKRMQGFTGQLEELKGALEELGIAIGKSGVLQGATGLVTALANVIDKVSAANPELIKMGLISAGLVAAIGPLNLAIGGIATGLGAMTKAMAGAASGAGALRLAMTGVAGFLGPGGLIAVGIGAVAAVLLLMGQRMAALKTPTREAQDATAKLAQSTADYETAAKLAANASGEARTKFLQEAAAKRELARQTIAATQAQLAQARATLSQLTADNLAAIEAERFSARGDRPGTIRPTLNAGRATKLKADIDALTKSIQDNQKALSDADKVIAAGNIKIAAGATAAAAAIETKSKALSKEAKELNDAKDALRDYIRAQVDELETRGLSAEQVKIRELQRKATEALALGLETEFRAILKLIDAYRQLQIEVEKVKDEAVEFERTPADLDKAIQEMGQNAKPTLEDLLDEFYRMRNSVDDVFYGIRNRDWVSAFAGLVRAIQQVKAAFDQAATSGDKMAAIAGAGQAVGSAVGGKAGAVIGGAASGAAIGFQFGGPIGAGIGAVIGGLGGLFGANKAKKRAKREAAERARLEAEARAREEASQKRELEIRLLELAGDATAARTAREADWLASLSAANQALGQQVLELEREAEARGAAAELARLTRELEIEVAEASGDAATALRLFRQDELEALPEALRPAKQAVFDLIDATRAREDAEAQWADEMSRADDKVADARRALTDAAEAEEQRLGEVAERFTRLADSLAEVRRELRSGDLVGANIVQQARAARAELGRLREAALAGDEAALAALPDALRAFASAEAAIAPNRRVLDQQLAVARQTAAKAELAARGRVSEAVQQINELKAQTGQLVEVKAATVSVADGIRDLNNALYDQQVTFARSLQAIEQIAAGVQGAVGAFQQALATSAPTLNTAPVDAAAISAGLAQPVLPEGMTPAANDGLALAIADAMEPMQVQLLQATRDTANILDDVTRGGQTLNVAALP